MRTVEKSSCRAPTGGAWERDRRLIDEQAVRGRERHEREH